MTATRVTQIGLLSVAVLMGMALPAAGSQPLALGDLENYLLGANQADYGGTQLVVTVFEGEAKAGVVDVAHAGEMLVLADSTLVGDGKVKAKEAGSVVVSDWHLLGTSERYSTLDPVDVRHLGRDAESVAVVEGSMLRAQIVFDKGTGAPLATQVYNVDGTPFRQSWMFQFDPRPPRGVYENSADDGGEYTVMLPASTEGVPAEIGGYRLGDRYAGPDSVYHSFYSDGLFSFSLFELEGRPPLAQFDEAMSVAYSGSRYDVLVAPAQLWVGWATPDTTYVVVGDLPPDHLEDVLAELPRPRKRNLLSRFWSGLFG